MRKVWPHDYIEEKVPCSHALPRAFPIDDFRIEDPDFAPDLTEQEGWLPSWPEGLFSLNIEINAYGQLGATDAFMHDRQIGAEADPEPITPSPGLDTPLLEANALYLVWEMETLHGYQTPWFSPVERQQMPRETGAFLCPFISSPNP